MKSTKKKMALRKRDGLILGLIAGSFALIFAGTQNNYPYKEFISQIALVFIIIFPLSAIFIGIRSTFKRKSLVSPGFDGFIYGFAVTFPIFSAIASVRAGQLPLPI